MSEMKLSDTVFNLPWNSDLVHQVVVAMTLPTPGRPRPTPRQEAGQRGRPEALEAERFG